jgi:hypothetical protein
VSSDTVQELSLDTQKPLVSPEVVEKLTLGELAETLRSNGCAWVMARICPQAVFGIRVGPRTFASGDGIASGVGSSIAAVDLAP